MKYLKSTCLRPNYNLEDIENNPFISNSSSFQQLQRISQQRRENSQSHIINTWKQNTLRSLKARCMFDYNEQSQNYKISIIDPDSPKEVQNINYRMIKSSLFHIQCIFHLIAKNNFVSQKHIVIDLELNCHYMLCIYHPSYFYILL